MMILLLLFIALLGLLVVILAKIKIWKRISFKCHLAKVLSFEFEAEKDQPVKKVE
jgi:hypothetical protein